MQSFCELTSWWNINYFKNSISPHFFYYPAELMFNNNFKVEILTKLYKERNETEYEINNGIKIRRFPQSIPKFHVELFNYMLKKSYSLIQLHTLGFSEDYIPWIISKFKKVPIVFTMHSASLLSARNKSSFYPRVLRKGMRIRDSENHIFIAFTEFQAKELEQLGIKNIKIIPHGIDPNVFKIEKDQKIAQKYGLKGNNILCVSDIRQQKRQHILIESMPEILHNFPDTKLFLVGRVHNGNDRKYRDLLVSKINKLGLNNNIRILNAFNRFEVTKNELIQLYLFSDIFAFPTETELSPIVSLESMASNTPMIATNIPYIKEILQNGNAGLLVNKDQEFENKIINLLDDTNLRNKLIKNGKSAINNKYHLDTVKNQYLDLYTSLIQN